MKTNQELIALTQQGQWRAFEREFDKSFLQQRRSVRDCLGFLRVVPVGDTYSLAKILHLLKHYARESHSYERDLLPHHRLPFGQIARSLNKGWFSSPQAKTAFMREYCVEFLMTERMRTVDWCDWLRDLVDLACQRQVTPEELDMALAFLAQNHTFLLSSQFFQITPSLQYRNYLITEILWFHRFALGTDPRGNQSGQLLIEILAASAPNRALYQQEVAFLKALSKDLAQMTLSLEWYQWLVQKMAHPTFLPVLRSWLADLQPPVSTIWRQLNKLKEMDYIWQDYLCDRFLQTLPGYQARQTCLELNNLILSRLTSPQTAQAFYSSIIYQGWASLVDQRSGLTPPEELITYARNYDVWNLLQSWLDVGYPIAVPGRTNLIQFAQSCQNLALAHSLDGYAQQNQRLRYSRARPMIYSQGSAPASSQQHTPDKR